MSEIQPTATNMLKDYAATASAADRDVLRRKVGEWVGQVFFGTLLKQMRSQMNPNNPLNGGRAAQTFGTQLDQTVISQWTQSARLEVADKIAQQWIGVKDEVQEQNR